MVVLCCIQFGVDSFAESDPVNCAFSSFSFFLINLWLIILK